MKTIHKWNYTCSITSRGYSNIKKVIEDFTKISFGVQKWLVLINPVGGKGKAEVLADTIALWGW